MEVSDSSDFHPALEGLRDRRPFDDDFPQTPERDTPSSLDHLTPPNAEVGATSSTEPQHLPHYYLHSADQTHHPLAEHDDDQESDTQSMYSTREAPMTEAEAAEAEAKAQRAKKEEEDFLRQQQESNICRICFEGPGSQDDEGKDLGRLLAPCKCKGTMRYIHSGCLDAWRKHSRNSSSAVACDQCGAPYRFRSSRFVGLANSRIMLALISIALFLFMVWIVGWLTIWTVDRFDGWDTVSIRLGALDTYDTIFAVDDDGFYRLVQEEDDDEISLDDLGFFGRQIAKMVLGSGMVGLISALASIGLAFNPIGVGRFATGGLRDRWLGGGGGSRRNKNDGLAVAAFVIVAAVVLAGVARALYSTYKLVRRMSRRILANAEDYIVDYYGDDEQPSAPEPPEQVADHPVQAPPENIPLPNDDAEIDPEPDWLPQDQPIPAN